MKTTSSLLAALGALALASPAFSQNATTTPVGAVNFTALANSDTYVSIPFPRPEEFTGTISGAAGSTLTIQSTPALQANQLVYQAGVQANTYFVLIRSGQAKGYASTIVSNTANDLVTEFEPDIIAMIQAGDSIAIHPYWTLGTVFPSADANQSFVPSLNNLGTGRRTEVLIPNITSTGQNKSAGTIYFYNGYWRKQGDVAANRNDDVLLPDLYFIVRNNNTAASTEIKFTGTVMKDFVVPLISSTVKNDNPVGLPIPKSITLNETNLAQGGLFVPSTNNLGTGRRDEILVVEGAPASPSKNRSASAIYFYNGYWRKQGDVGPDQGATVIPQGSAIIVRKYQTGSNQALDWRVSLEN